MKTKDDELVAAGEIKPNPHWHTAPHFHGTHHEIIVILGGEMLLRTQEIEFTAVPGDVLFYRMGLIHEEISQARNPVHQMFIAFRFHGKLAGLPLKMSDPDGRLRELTAWLIHDRQQGRPSGECLPLLRAMLSELGWNVAHAHNPWLEATRTFMRRNFGRKLTLGEIAAQAGMSRFAFIRKFKRQAGSTPMEELRRIRLNEARNLILSSNLPLKRIAPAAGLGDEYQLSKLFRRYFGLSPREIRSPRFEPWPPPRKNA